ncbi:Cytochrome c oxidase-assembly factor COX23, mitochondrial [Grifola frondosa]|uniref:Cytochrome c oxidase-assembly factor COX23, mitochondrial n=1 Tax=Grifola frondosa TaxID=5627 RepID=A0A1C7MAA1_GRIFR|nr:Cytochrome c oxidase-assembly factor COX23, mitochondrial [Grifola frondosa]
MSTSRTTDAGPSANRGTEPLPHPRANVEPQNYRDQFRGDTSPPNLLSAFSSTISAAALIHADSPCEDASKASMDCLNRNEYDRDKCLDFFQAYRDCKKTWIEQRKADRRAGRPHLDISPPNIHPEQPARTPLTPSALS